jgi:GntR family transcriptional regulator
MYYYDIVRLECPAMDLQIDVASPEPVYEQIIRQIQLSVQDGRLSPGAPLPSIRQLANDLDLNPNTVARAYRALETNRVIRTAGSRGTFVGRDAPSQIRTRNGQDAVFQLTELVTLLMQKGMSASQIETAFRSAVRTASTKGTQ